MLRAIFHLKELEKKTDTFFSIVSYKLMSPSCCLDSNILHLQGNGSSECCGNSRCQTRTFDTRGIIPTLLQGRYAHEATFRLSINCPRRRRRVHIHRGTSTDLSCAHHHSLCERRRSSRPQKLGMQTYSMSIYSLKDEMVLRYGRSRFTSKAETSTTPQGR